MKPLASIGGCEDARLLAGVAQACVGTLCSRLSHPRTSSIDSMSRIRDSSSVRMKSPESTSSHASPRASSSRSSTLKSSASASNTSDGSPSDGHEAYISASGQFSAMHDSNRRRCRHDAGSGDDGAVVDSKFSDDGPELLYSSSYERSTLSAHASIAAR